VEAPPLRDEDLVRVAQRIAQRVQALLDRRLAHRRVDDEPPGEQQQQASGPDNLASLGPRAGKKTRRVGRGSMPPGKRSRRARGAGRHGTSGAAPAAPLWPPVRPCC